jgi:hypothetical protein
MMLTACLILSLAFLMILVSLMSLDSVATNSPRLPRGCRDK